MKNLSIFRAFSLVEMLMALLVAALLMAALAPVMTRRMNENVNVTGTGQAVIPAVFCAYANDTTESMVYDTEEKGCVVPENTYSAGAIIVSGGGGGGGAADMAKSSAPITLLTLTNDKTVSKTETKTFDKYTRDMEVKIVGAGGGGGGGDGTFFRGKATKQIDCTRYGIGKTDTAGNVGTASNPLFVYDSMNGGMCVSQFNQTGAAGCTTYTYGTYSAKLCRMNQTHSPAACTNLTNTINDGTVWRLPTETELNKWATSSAFVSSTLKGCNCSSDYSGTYCPSSSSTAEYLPCWIMSSTVYGYGPCSSGYASMGMGMGLNGNTLGVGGGCEVSSGVKSIRYTAVRCMSEGPFDIQLSYPGGGGSAGVFSHVKVPNKVILRATMSGDGKVRTTAGAGGAGGSERSVSKGTSGGLSKVEVLDTANNLIWSLSVPGGNPGTGATTEKGGEAGEEENAICKYFDITSEQYKTEKEIECSKLPADVLISQNPGLSGISGYASTNAGYGAGGYWNGSSTENTKMGLNGTIPGSGGGGNNCTENNEDPTNPLCKTGANGAGGGVSVTYKKAYPGIGGGGGSAGTLLHIKSFQVRPGDLIKVKVGERGRGGSPAADGLPGGNSYIELKSGLKYEVLGGGGGRAGNKGDLNVSPNVMSAPGAPGTASGVASSTKSKLAKKDEIYPSNSEETLGAYGVETLNMTTSAGGNGGVNHKISGLAETNDGTPCGGNSVLPVKINDETEWQCNNSSYVPLPLSRVISTTSFDPNILTTYAPGATGGGGGGWDETNQSKPVSSGANGMGGYVYIYFGDWSGE